jgi:pyridoxal phosphate enzyme (YggS family)
MFDLVAQIGRNLAEIHGRIAAAAARCGRRADEVRLVVVTKAVGPREIRAVVAAGAADLGENRPQQLWERAAALAELPIRWHMIGHLQRNKVRRTLACVHYVHAVDSLRLALAIDEEAAHRPPPSPPAALGPIPVLLEVNISAEPAKHGFAPAEVEPLLPQLAGLENIEVRGLMCMAGLEGGLEAARRQFAALRRLRDRLHQNSPPGIMLGELSMGMSGDFEVAVEEGATMVRIGSGVFEGLGIGD